MRDPDFDNDLATIIAVIVAIPFFVLMVLYFMHHGPGYSVGSVHGGG
jgi:hypothetical protein